MSLVSGDLTVAGHEFEWNGNWTLLGRVGVFRRVLLRLLRAVVAADGDLLATDLDLDSAIVDVPVAHGTFLRVFHKLTFQFEFKYRRELQGRRGRF